MVRGFRKRRRLTLFVAMRGERHAAPLPPGRHVPLRVTRVMVSIHSPQHEAPVHAYAISARVQRRSREAQWSPRHASATLAKIVSSVFV